MTLKNRIGIFCNPKANPPFEIIAQVVSHIYSLGGTVLFHQELAEKLKNSSFEFGLINTFGLSRNPNQQMDVLFSIGGDGTFLGTVPFVVNSNIPVVGLNIGRLGFLSNVSKSQFITAIDDWFSENYCILERSLIEVTNQTNQPYFQKNSALNDITIRRSESANMMSFKVFIDGKFLNNYWADGIILSTPTGSTAYSLSCGGPILDPNTAAFIITPIASHNLTVRPLVVSDNAEIVIAISGRTDHFSLSIDSDSYTVAIEEQIHVKKAIQTIKTVVFNNVSFYDSIRDKLSWGVDVRNN